MDLFVLGTSHAVASTGLRERLHVDHEALDRTLGHLRASGMVDEAAALVTCGRLEVYATSARPFRAAGALRRLVGARAGLSREQQVAHSYLHRGPEAAAHLFRVAAGMDSVVHGEAQILGQVRDVLNRPATRRTAGPVIQRLIQAAVAAGRQVRSETTIGRGPASLAGAALAILRREIGALDGVRALVVGAGETGTLVAHLLRKTGVRELTVANRSLGRARALAHDVGAEAAGLDRLPDLVRDADLVVTAVAAPERTLLARDVEADGRTRWLLDLSHPRAIDPAAADVEGVRLFDLEHVSEQVTAARAERRRQIPRAEAIVQERARTFETWRHGRASVDVLRAVRERVLERARTEAERLSRGRGAEEQEAMRRMARSLARALLHEPTVALRGADPASLEGRWMVESAASLFGVDAPSETSS